VSNHSSAANPRFPGDDAGPDLGHDLERRRAELRATLPIRRVVGPDDLAALMAHLMTNSAVTGATFDIDGGQQLLP
jgi:NAD(P)-dependent dehydrogenase (short-subunit alcohol dehydrogenase family)